MKRDRNNNACSLCVLLPKVVCLLAIDSLYENDESMMYLNVHTKLTEWSYLLKLIIMIEFLSETMITLGSIVHWGPIKMYFAVLIFLGNDARSTWRPLVAFTAFVTTKVFIIATLPRAMTTRVWWVSYRGWKPRWSFHNKCCFQNVYSSSRFKN